ncbi:MAG: alpha/beta hydrolase [Telluria sp.]
MDNSRKLASMAAGFASVLWLGLTAVVASNQRRLLFNPVTEPEVFRPRSAGHRTRAVVLRGQDGTRLSGWMLTPPSPGPHPAVLYFGGRSEEVSWVVRDAATLFPGMAVLAVNYRGYGGSLGDPAEHAIVEDGRMLFDWLAEHGAVDAARIALVGRSLGSGVAVQVARDRPAAAVVLITPYDSIVALAKRRFRAVPIDYVLRHRFESVKYAPALKAPTFVLRAASDDIVPHLHTDELVRQLANLHGDATVPGSDHLNIPYLAGTQALIARFLCARLFPPSPLAVPAAALAG